MSANPSQQRQVGAKCNDRSKNCQVQERNDVGKRRIEIERLSPKDRDKCVLIGEINDDGLAQGIERINPTTAINILHYARGSKTPYELECMRLAARRGTLGHRAAEAAFRDERPEFAIHQAYCEATSHSDNELPYGNIIALNEHGAVLHYTNLDRDPPDAFRSFLIDAGAQVLGYASDITRTYGDGSQLFTSLIERMESLQSDVVGFVRTGVDYRDIHLRTHELIADVLVDVDLANGDPRELVDEAFLRRIRHKIQIGPPSKDLYVEIFKLCCNQRSIKFNPATIDYLYATFYDQGKTPRSSDPRDLLEIIQSICRFRNQQVVLTEDLMAEATQRFFCQI